MRQGRARRHVGAGRAADRRALHRREHRPRRRRALRPEHRRRAVVIASAIGGENIGETVEGLQRFPINVRYPREMRDSLEKLRDAADRDRARRADPLGDVAEIRITDGPPMLRSENARLSGWVYVDIRGRDLRSAVQRHAAARSAKR